MKTTRIFHVDFIFFRQNLRHERVYEEECWFVYKRSVMKLGEENEQTFTYYL